MGFFHFLVGICIGISSLEWEVHLLTPFFWGGACCVYASLYCQEEFLAFVRKGEELRVKKRISISPALLFYLDRYVPATSLALTGSMGSAFMLNYVRWE